MDKIRWGILATGRIAHKFARGLTHADRAELVAVGSRQQGTADAFADEWRVPHRHASYEALANDPDVDVVYVATPHPFHKENSLLCLEAGKAVLCEKPLTINAGEAEEVIACARERRLFLMEAMWTRFLPAICKLRELLKAGAFGEVSLVTADFCFRASGDPAGRLLDPALGGGALLDVGIYAIALAHMAFGGPPEDVTGCAHVGQTGVDEQDGIVLRFPGGGIAALTCGIRAAMPHEAMLVGTEGWARLHAPFWKTQRLTIGVEQEEKEVLDLPYRGNGYECEAEEVMRRLRAGKLESDVMPLDESLSILRTMDALRRQWGLRYPTE